MRLFAPVFLLSATAALAGGWQLMRALEPALAESHDAAPIIDNALARFTRTTKPVARIDLQETPRELLDPATALPHVHKFPAEEIRALHAFASTCVTNVAGESRTPELAKAWLWAAFECGQATLPANFYATQPYMHPTGVSYAALGGAELHHSYLHATERHLWKGPDPLRGLTRPVLRALLAGDPIARTNDRLIVGTRHVAAAEVEPGYALYDLAAWDLHAEALGYVLVEHTEKTPCAHAAGAFCWVDAEPVDTARIYVLGALAAAGLVGMIALLSILLAGRVRAQRREREHQTFMLRALTHELRTPATALSLALETLRNDFDALPDQSQEAFLRLCEDTQRLHRVIAGSSRYLKAVEGRGPEAQPLASLSAYFDTVLEPYHGKIQIERLPEDRAFRTDPYWLMVCVQNLIDNALRHGKGAVRVRLGWRRRALEVTVQDEGALAHADAARLAREGGKSRASLGLGLGLVIRALKDLGGDLSLRRAPTTFTIRLKELTP